MNVLERIKYYMMKNKWTEYRLSKETDIAQSTLNSLFHKHKSPSLSTLSKICDAFHITLFEFFAESENFQHLTEKHFNLIQKVEHLTQTQKEALDKLIDSIIKKA